MSSEAFELKLQEIMREMEDISHIAFYLFSAEGSWIAGSEPESREELSRAVEVFRDSAAESQIAYGFQFQKILIQGKIKYILLSDMSKTSEYSFVVSQMAASQIRNLHEISHKMEDEEEYFRQLLTGELSPEAYRLKSKKAAQSDETPFLIFVMEFEREKTEAVHETVKNLVLQEENEYFLDMSETRTILVKNASGMGPEDCEEFANLIIDNIQGEAMMNVKVGYSTPVTQIFRLGKNYQEACTALRVYSIFCPKAPVAVYGHLGIGQLIYQLPLDLCERFLREVFADEQQKQLDEEMMTTVNMLFENNLNISETARQLYVHRNTLVYRLERIQKILGLDLRVFEDAMLFRIAMMVQAHVDHLKNEKNA